MTFPSLLHSEPSTENFHLLAQETNRVLNDSKAGVGTPPWEAKSPQLSRSPPTAPFAVATPFYFSSSLTDAGFTRLQPPGFVVPTSTHPVLEPQPPPPTNDKYSPASEFSLEESTTSSAYDDPFHWDAVLAGLPPSPRRSPTLAVTVGKGLSIRTSPVARDHSPRRGSMCFGSIISRDIIPTIVVLNPDAVMVPTQASVSSIIGLYVGRPESAQTATGEMPTQEEEVEQESNEGDTDGEDSSSSESEFEIVAVPALKVRLDTILETDEMDVENSFSSLMVCVSPLSPVPALTIRTQTLGSMGSGNIRTSATEEPVSTEPLVNGRALPSFSSATEPSVDLTSVLSGRIVQTNPKVSASNSFASTAKLFYAQSGTSISGESTISSCRPTASESENEYPWLFYVEDGRILEVPQSTSTRGGGKLADKLARFPNVPKSPQLTPLPSPFASPPSSPSPANRFFLDGPLPTPDIKRQPGGITSLDVDGTGSRLSPYWGRNAAECSTALSSGTSQPTTSVGPSSVAEISFGELDVDLGLSNNFDTLVFDSLPTGSPYSSGYSTKLSTAQSATPSHGRHVRFESADFRMGNMAGGSKRHSPHHRRLSIDRSKTCLKKKRRGEKTKGWKNRDSSDASTTLMRSLPGEVGCDPLSSSFSSGSIPKRGSWWQHGRLLVVIGRIRRGIRGCLSLEEEEIFGSPAWATEHDYWDDHLTENESRRSDDLMGDDDDDGGTLLRRIRRYA